MAENAKFREMPALSSESLEAILNDVGVGLVVLDQRGKVTLANKAARALLEGPPQQWPNTVRVQDSEGKEISLSEVMEDLEPGDFRVTLPDGRLKWLLVAGYRFSVLGFPGVFAIIADETAQVEARNAKELLHRMEVVERLAGAMVHDFNNVLSVISGNVALAREDPGMSETSRGHLEHVDLALRKARAVSAQLKKFSRTEKTQSGPLQINEAVTTALELARPLLGTGVGVQSYLQPDLPVMEGNQVDIEQTVLNLIINAVDAMPQGGHLMIRTELAASPRTKPEEQYVLVTVADTGMGIPEHLRTKIFEPFFTTKLEGKGTGLGLSSAYGIVRQHKGHITVESVQGVGSKFSIYLPLAVIAPS